MRIVSANECKAWLGESFTWPECRAAYLLPKDAGRKTALARALQALLDCSDEGLLWVTEWGVFPSSENMALFDGYRRFLGEERSLRDAPGHFFGETDRREVECLLDLILYFSWGATVIDGGSSRLRISHDEVLIVHTKDAAVLTQWREALAAFELDPL